MQITKNNKNNQQNFITNKNKNNKRQYLRLILNNKLS